MKARGVLAIALMACWFGAAPAAAYDCCRHGQHCADGNQCNHDCDHSEEQGSHHCCNWTPSGSATDLRAAEGRITEIIYLPGATADSGMVELRLQPGGQNQRVRLAPVGFLKQNNLLLHEGDTVIVKGFPVAGLEGDILVATELHQGEKNLSLRNTRGRPVW